MSITESFVVNFGENSLKSLFGEFMPSCSINLAQNLFASCFAKQPKLNIFLGIFSEPKPAAFREKSPVA
jgi:hypothetical protein